MYIIQPRRNNENIPCWRMMRGFMGAIEEIARMRTRAHP
jgi:hypothetical protein